MERRSYVCVLHLLLLLLITFVTEVEAAHHKGQRCGKGRCSVGQTCAKNRQGHHECVCRAKCPRSERLVCASDGRTFLNRCELHRAACLQATRLRVAHDGACNNTVADTSARREKKTGTSANGKKMADTSTTGEKMVDGGKTAPLVCYQLERDELRQLVVESLYQKSRKEARSFTRVMREKFDSCDKNQDEFLDSEELLECLEKTPASKGTPEHLHRVLCVDALLTEGAHDDNWMLDFHEFSRLFHPHFQPQTKECALEEKNYGDGSETKLDCNWCVCACGDWVCTGGQCMDGKQDTARPDTQVRSGRLPSVEERRRFLKGFAASAEVDLAAIQKTVAEQLSRSQDLEELLNLE